MPNPTPSPAGRPGRTPPRAAGSAGQSTSHGASVDRLARLVRRVLDVPMSMVSVLAGDVVLLPGADGLPEPWQAPRRPPEDLSFCRFVVGDDAPLRITDARQDPDLAGTGAVTRLGVVAYCGVPLTDADGAVLGALCAIDTQPRTWTDDDVATLADLAAVASLELSLREQTLAAQVGQQNAEDQTDATAVLLALSEALTDTETLADVAAAVTHAAMTALGTEHVYLGVAEHRERRLAFVPVAGRASDQLPAAAGVPLDPGHPAGWAGVHRAPLFLPDAAATRARFPGTWSAEGGPVDYAATAHLPLVVAGELVGTLSLLWAAPRTFDPADRSPMLALARYTAEATARAMMLAERRSAAAVLQQAMLTDVVAPASGDLAVRYVPAHGADQVGGDWYDAFVTADGVQVLVIGDITGHDVAAAASMGQLRSILRAYGWPGGRTPAQVLTQLDDAVVGLGLGVLATVLVAQLAPPSTPGGPARLTWSNAGHPAPILLDADGEVDVLERPADLLIGVDPDRLRHDHTVPLPTGSTLLLVTDGLVEHGRSTIDAGSARLVEQVRAAAGLPLPDLLDALLAGVEDSSDDDVAVLAHRVG